jgi:hypothetical protein
VDSNDWQLIATELLDLVPINSIFFCKMGLFLVLFVVALCSGCSNCFPNGTCFPGFSLLDCSVVVPPLPKVFAVRSVPFPALAWSPMFPQDDVIDLWFADGAMLWFSRHLGKMSAPVTLSLRGTPGESSSSYHVHVHGGKFLGKSSFGLKRFLAVFCFWFLFLFLLFQARNLWTPVS